MAMLPSRGRFRSLFRGPPLWIVILTIAIALIVLFASWMFVRLQAAPSPSSAPLPPPVSYFPALDSSTALNLSNQTVLSQPGGPWTLTTLTGLASDAPAFPMGNAAAQCQTPGPMLGDMGGALVSSQSALASGYAPLWEMLYMNSSNSSLTVIVANDSAHVEGPYPYGSPCNYDTGNTIGWTGPNRNLLLDTSQLAPMAWDQVGKETYANYSGPLLVVYAYGDLPLLGSVPYYGTNYGPDWIVDFTPCWVSPLKFSTFTYMDFHWAIDTSNGSLAHWPGSAEGTCFLNSYHFQFRPLSSAPVAGQNWSIPLLSLNDITSDLTTWMVRPNLINASTDRTEPPAPVSCRLIPWENLTCQTSGNGWYLALTNPRGQWLDVYAEENGTGSWVYPNVAIDPGDIFLLESSAESYLEGAQFSVTSNSNVVTVSGNITL